MKTYFYSIILTILVGSACNRSVSVPTSTNFEGTWTLAEILGNDHWGGPIYWKQVTGLTKIQFTNDGRYLRKYSTDTTYTLIGTFKKLSDSTIQITQVNPPIQSSPSYILFYSFSTGGYLTWGNFGTEAVVKEKFKLDN